MSKWIDADALMDFLTNIPIDLGYREIDDVKEYVKRQPAADVAPVRHGKWIEEYREHEVFGTRLHRRYCSCCNEAATFPYDFCPHCGALMDQGDNDEQRC